MSPIHPKMLLILILIFGLQTFLSTRSNKRWGFVLPVGVVTYWLLQITLTIGHYEDYCQQGGSASLDTLILYDVYAMLLSVLLLIGLYGVSRRVILRK